MATNEIVWQGLAELKRELARLPAHLSARALGIVQGKAEAAARDLGVAYPKRAGKLRRGVKVERQHGGPHGVDYVVKNVAKHAYMFEVGTMARHTDLGAFRGSMPAGKVFIPIMRRRRREMYVALSAMMVEEGLEVRGHV